MSGHEFDTRIRSHGWHCMWLAEGFSRSGLGRTEASATRRALGSALEAVSDFFNAAEMTSVRVIRYPGFRIAKVTLHARHVQED